MYICEDANESNGCNEEGIMYNQCCQDCDRVRTCKHHCEYAHDFDCLVKATQSE